MAMVDQEPLSPDSEHIQSLEPVADLVQDLLSVRGEGIIRIFTGVAHPDMYNNQLVIEAIRYVRRVRDARLRILTGPLLMVDESGTNGLLRLVEEGCFERFACKTTRDSTPDSRTVEVENGFRCYQEGPPLDVLPSQRRFRNPLWVSPYHLQWSARVANHDLDIFFEDPDPDIKRMTRPISGSFPLVIPRTQYDAFKKAMRDAGKVFKYLSPEELLNLGAERFNVHPWTKA